MEPILFDSSKPIKVRIISGEAKTCEVSWPTDEQWASRARRQRFVRQNIGRGKTRLVPTSSGKLDTELFEQIRLDKGGVPFDDAEAAMVISRLDRAQVADVIAEPGGYRITLDCGKAQTAHVLKSPTAAQRLKHDRLSAAQETSGRFTETRIALEPSGDLYDALMTASEGYVGAVPLPHKYAVVFELLQTIEREEEDSDPEA